MKGLDGGVPEPFLRAGAVLSRSMFLANQAAQLVSGFLHPHPYDASGAARLLSGGDLEIPGNLTFITRSRTYMV